METLTLDDEKKSHMKEELLEEIYFLQSSKSDRNRISDSQWLIKEFNDNLRRNNELHCLKENIINNSNLMRLYENHDVKNDLVLGPELIQQRVVKARDLIVFEDDFDVNYDKMTKKPDIKEEFNLSNNYSKQDRTKTGDIFICDICSEIYVRKCDLVRHIREHNQNVVKYVKKKHKKTDYSCDVCKKTITNKSNLETHKRLHLNENVQRKYECDFCHKKFKRSDTLKVHKRVHTGEMPYFCEICKRHFRDKPFYNKHKCLNQVKKDQYPDFKNKVKKKYTCDVCHKEYGTKYDLRRHIYSHSGSKQFKCNICQKSYSRSFSLKLHLQTHSGKRMYQCSFCEKEYTRNWILMKHLEQCVTKKS